MKILFLGQFPPPFHGVAQMNLYAHDAIKSQHEVFEINLSFSNDIKSIKKIEFTKILKTVKALLDFNTYLYRHSPDLIYFTLCPTGVAFFRDCIFYFFGRFFKKKFILHLHGQGVKQKSNSRVYDYLYKKIFATSVVIHLSEVFYDDVSKYVSRDNFFVLNNCILKPKNICLSSKQSNEPVRFIFLSNLMIGKGFDLYLQAITGLYALKKKFVAEIIGEFVTDNDKNYYENWVLDNKKIIDDGTFILRPSVYGEEKFKYLSGSHVFVFPSRIDTYPIVLIEAMSVGLACISTRTGAMPEMLRFGDAGLLIDTNSSSQLQAAMLQLIECENKLEELRMRSIINYEKNFEFEKFKNDLNNILELSKK